MKSRPSFIMAALALLGAGASSSTMAISNSTEPPVLSVGAMLGGGRRTKRKVKGQPHGNGKRRKNPFRGTTYASIIGVSSHIN